MYASIIFSIAIGIVFIVSFLKDKVKSKEAALLAFKSFKKIGPLLLIVLTFLIFIEGFFTPDIIQKYTSQLSGVWGYAGAAILGGIIHIPLFISFPIGGQLLKSGVNPGFITVLITSLVMVHSFSIPIEVKEMGYRFAILRNILSLAAAIIIGIIMGALY